MEDIKITNNSDEVLKNLGTKKRRILEMLGIKLERYAKALCPVGTPESTGIKGYRGGTLRNSITYATKIGQGQANTSGGKQADPQDYKMKAVPEEGAVYVGTNVEYAPYQELGTSTGVRPKHFLRDAVANHVDEYKNIIRTELSKNH